MGLADPTFRVFVGNARVMAIPDHSVHMIFVSPPYWGQRSYEGVDPDVWPCTTYDALTGAATFSSPEDCPGHEWGPTLPPLPGAGNRPDKPSGFQQKSRGGQAGALAQMRGSGGTCGQWCQVCGAWRGTLGNEPLLSMFVAHLVWIFQEARRVLRPDGSLWVNLGDTYFGSWGNYGSRAGGQRARNTDHYTRPPWESRQEARPPQSMPQIGLKNKDMIGLPWRMAFALQADGWYLRSAIVWVKGVDHVGKEWEAQEQVRASLAEVRAHAAASLFGLSADLDRALKRAEKACDALLTAGAVMPESVFSRCTTAHEYLFQLTPNKDSYFDIHALRHDQGSERNARTVWAFPGEIWRVPTENKGTFILPDGRQVAHFACVSEDTEILTLDGWEGYSQFKRRIRDGGHHPYVATFNVGRQVIEYQRLQRLHEYPFDGELVHVGNRDLDILMTEDHRCIVRKREHHYDQEVLAADLRNADKIRVAAPVESYPENSGIGELLAALIGWIVTEGHYPHSHGDRRGVMVYQNEGDHADEIRGILNHLGIPYTEKTRMRPDLTDKTACVFRLRAGPWTDMIRFIAPEKTLNRFLVSLPLAECRALFDAIIKGDGHVRKSDGRISNTQRKRADQDWFSILALRLGYHPHVGVKNVHLTQRTHIGIRATNGAGTTVERVSYKGIVWCPQTPNGTWIARRNGRMFVTGNSFPLDLPRRAIRAATSWAGACKSCGAPWVRIVRRRNPDRGQGEPYAKGRQSNDQSRTSRLQSRARAARHAGGPHGSPFSKFTTVGWAPSCRCHGEPDRSMIPCDRCRGTGGDYQSVPRTDVHMPADEARKSHKCGHMGDVGQSGMERTGEPCPKCKGAGEIEGDVWPPEMLEAWPRVPCSVLDSMGGTGTTALAALAEGRTGLYNDVSPLYADLAAARLGVWPDELPQVRAKRAKKADVDGPEGPDQMELWED